MRAWFVFLGVDKGGSKCPSQPPNGWSQRTGARFFPDVMSERRKGDTHVIVGKVPLKSKEKIPCSDGAETLE